MIIDIQGNKGRLVNIVLCASIILLFIVVSYNRFLIYHDRYLPLYRLSWNPSLYPNDLIHDHVYMKAMPLPFLLIGYLSPLVKYLGEENLLFIIYLIRNLLILFIIYKTAMLYGSRKLAMFFSILLFRAWQLLPAADVSVVYAHHLSPTGFALIPALLSIYFFINRKYFSFFITLALLSITHCKTISAIGIPLIIYGLWDFMRSPRDRRTLASNLLLTSPVWIVIFCYYLFVFTYLRGCEKSMLNIKHREISLLAVNILSFDVINYIFINVVSIYLYLKNSLKTSIDKRIFGLILASNIALFLGILVQVIGRMIPLPAVIYFLHWPKIALLPTYLSLLLISRYLIFNRSFWENLRPLSMGFGLFFVTPALLNINILNASLMQKVLFVIFLFYIIVTFFKKVNRQIIKRLSFLIIVFFIALGSVYINLRELQVNLNNKIKYKWNKTIYRMPFQFDSYVYEYDAIKWLNNNASSKSMFIFPVIVTEDANSESFKLEADPTISTSFYTVIGDIAIRFYNARAHSYLPIFYASDIGDVHGHCTQYKRWRRREEILQQWLYTKDIRILSENNISYVIARKIDRDYFEIPIKLRVYENEKVIIYRVKG